MDQDRWKTVNVIFHAALEVSSSERHSFVLTASEGDPDLQAEVELLLKADRDAGSYLESPLVPAELFSNSVSPVNPGDVLCGRFRILRAVGEGGMGHVFEALDSELAVHVALKIIRPEIAANPEALVRFRQEVRLARRITHPNVCRTFDIERETRVVDAIRSTKQEVVFLTMEFLEGETLASRIKRDGPLPLNEALHVARQTADALQAANTLGIVHRDMKPANIMLVPSEATAPIGFRAVITDFGLARLDPVVSPSNLSAFSNTARPIGTLAYMAPEQLENAQISSATDIYAFGLVLFEMVTGTRAFPSDNLLSGIAQRLTGSPPLPQSLVPGLPTHWCRSIEGCLRLRPADRFQCATDVMEVLDGKRAGLPRIGKPSLGQRLALASWPRGRRLFALVAICLVVMAFFLGGLRLYRSVADFKVAPGALVYLAPVSNQTGEKSLNNVTELLRAGLSQSVQVNLLDQGRVGDILQQMTKAPDSVIDLPIAREIAMRAGAVRIIFTTVTGSAGSYRLNIDIQQPDNTPTRYRDHWLKSFAWAASDDTNASATIPPELLKAVRKSSDWIRNEVGESVNDIARLDVPPEDLTTNSWEALADYEDAQRLSLKNEPAEAVQALLQAIQIDPQFALAYGRLGDVLAALHRTPDAYEAYRSALSADLNRRLTRRERDRIKGMYAVDSGDMQAAELAFRDYSIYYENDPLGWAYQSYPLEMLGRTEEAISVLKRAADLEPHRSFPINELIACMLTLGRYDEARQLIVRLRQEGFSDFGLEQEGQLDFLVGKIDLALAAFQSLQNAASPSSRYLSKSLLARLAAEQGRSEGAIGYLVKAVDLASANRDSDEQARFLLDLAYLRAMRGETAHCLENIDQAISLNPSVQNILSASTALSVANMTRHGSASRGVKDSLNRLENKLPPRQEGPIFEVAHLRMRGEILMADGKSREALSLFQSADKLDSPESSRDYLARAFVQAANRQHNPKLKNEFLQKAAQSYAVIALRPGLVWCRPTYFPPGFYADQLKSYLQIAIQEQSTHAELSESLVAFDRLRHEEMSSSTDLEQALLDVSRRNNNLNQ